MINQDDIMKSNNKKKGLKERNFHKTLKLMELCNHQFIFITEVNT